MMTLEDERLRYREDERLQAVELDYGAGTFRFVVVLPKEGNAFDAGFLAALGAADASWLQGRDFYAAEVTLGLPRFRAEFGADLKEALSALGLAGVLAEVGSFAGIAAPPPRLAKLLQKAAIVVNEEGSEAAAATAAVMGRSFQKTRKVTMTVDRPFVFAIRDERTGAILFAGVIADPRAGETAE